MRSSPRVCDGVKGGLGVLQFNRCMNCIKYNHRAWLVFGVVLGEGGGELWVKGVDESIPELLPRLLFAT